MVEFDDRQFYIVLIKNFATPMSHLFLKEIIDILFCITIFSESNMDVNKVRNFEHKLEINISDNKLTALGMTSVNFLKDLKLVFKNNFLLYIH